MPPEEVKPHSAVCSTPSAKFKVDLSRFINGEQFVELIFEHYAQLAPRYRSMIPLKQIFVPDLPQE